VLGAILCGGQSRRMGSAKALLPWAGVTLLEHARRRVAEAGLDPICLGPVSWAAQAGMPALADSIPGSGPLGGLLAALEAGGDVFALAVDMPLLEPSEIAALAAHGLRLGVATVPEYRGRVQPLCGYWPGGLAAPMRAYLLRGGRKVVAFLATVQQRTLSEHDLGLLGVAPAHLRNLNTPSDYAEAQSAMARARGE